MVRKLSVILKQTGNSFAELMLAARRGIVDIQLI